MRMRIVNTQIALLAASFLDFVALWRGCGRPALTGKASFFRLIHCCVVRCRIALASLLAFDWLSKSFQHIKPWNFFHLAYLQTTH